MQLRLVLGRCLGTHRAKLGYVYSTRSRAARWRRLRGANLLRLPQEGQEFPSVPPLIIDKL